MDNNLPLNPQLPRTPILSREYASRLHDLSSPLGEPSPNLGCDLVGVPLMIGITSEAAQSLALLPYLCIFAIAGEHLVISFVSDQMQTRRKIDVALLAPSRLRIPIRPLHRLPQTPAVLVDSGEGLAGHTSKSSQ